MRRSPQLFAQVAHGLMERVDRKLRRQGRELLYALDSTSITLTGKGLEAWTSATRTRHTQGVKVHVLYEPGAQAPRWHSITAPNVNDRDEAVRLELQRGALYVFDKAYCDYNWWHRIDAAAAHFVTRFKRNAALKVEQERPVPPEDSAVVLRDQTVRFSHRSPGGGRRNHYTQALRRVEIAREGSTPLVLATNDLHSPARQIAQHYKQRWEVELFFKWIKQHLNIKRFLGHSENAVKTQILTALITYLLLALYRQLHGIQDSLHNLLIQLRSTLFQRPGLEAHAYHRRRQRSANFAALQQGLF
jgi:IS4 transposase